MTYHRMREIETRPELPIRAYCLEVPKVRPRWYHKWLKIPVHRAYLLKHDEGDRLNIIDLENCLCNSAEDLACAYQRLAERLSA